MSRVAKDGHILVADDVVIELSKKDDGAHEWIRSHDFILVKLDSEIEKHVREIMIRFPRLVDTKKGRSVGDPFVIALARAKNLTVITAEAHTGQIEVPKIPDVCDELGIRSIGIVEFFRELGWKL
jgi:hypothetical protein